MKHATFAFTLCFATLALAAPPDGLITARAKLALLTTAGIKSNALHVDTSDGDVTLFGKVSSGGQRDASERVVRSVEGVRSVRNLLQLVEPAMLERVTQSDADVRTRVTSKLTTEATLKNSRILVQSVDKGVVLLVGEASFLSDHLKAVWLAGQVPGAVRIISEIKAPDGFIERERLQFRSAAAPTLDTARDMRISADVKLRLLTAAEVPSTEIAVDTENGVVTLFGIVPSEAVKANAGMEARKATGVVLVQNELEIVTGSRKALVESKDADLARDLKLAFTARPELKSVRVLVKNGTVQLSGTVATGWDELMAVRVARAVPGVRGIEDQLQLQERP
jgi:hyperosmotically inducible periplasmic protein